MSVVMEAITEEIEKLEKELQALEGKKQVSGELTSLTMMSYVYGLIVCRLVRDLAASFSPPHANTHTHTLP